MLLDLLFSSFFLPIFTKINNLMQQFNQYKQNEPHITHRWMRGVGGLLSSETTSPQGGHKARGDLGRQGQVPSHKIGKQRRRCLWMVPQEFEEVQEVQEVQNVWDVPDVQDVQEILEVQRVGRLGRFVSLKSSHMTLAPRASLVQHGSSELKILKIITSNFNERNMLLAFIISRSFLAKQTVVSRCVDFFCVMDLATNYSQRDVLITGTVKKLKPKISGRNIVKKQELNNIESFIFMYIF